MPNDISSMTESEINAEIQRLHELRRELRRKGAATLASPPSQMKAASPSEALLPSDVLHLNARQIEALRKAREHVRQSLAQQHGWTMRDDALDAIDLALRAARVVMTLDDARDAADTLPLRAGARSIRGARKPVYWL